MGVVSWITARRSSTDLYALANQVSGRNEWRDKYAAPELLIHREVGVS
jgi:hypothetical protein